MTKLKVGVLYGGKSPEHEVSLQSALNIIAGIDREKFDLYPIAIDKKGRWFLGDIEHLVVHAEDPLRITLHPSKIELVLQPGASSPIFTKNGEPNFPPKLDIIFPVLHGANGEDGAIQGLLKYLDIPCVGPSILGSALGMDKDIMKRLLRDAGINTAKWILIQEHEKEKVNIDTIINVLGLPLYVKPANLGSSVGVHRVEKKEDFLTALYDALSYDPKVIIEEAIIGRELECAILGNTHPRASLIGEVLTEHSVYSYEAKYLDQASSDAAIPADLDNEKVRELQEISLRVYQTINAAGLSRVDSFLTADGEIYVNEINTIPGFTDISMYPKLWEASGIAPKELLTQLLMFAINRHKKSTVLKQEI